MATGNAFWGIDVGQCALKAIKLRMADEGRVEAVAFDVIEHAKILSQPDADRDELINSALEKFASRNDWQGDRFIVGVPGQQTFARFCKMPPIDLKKDSKKIHDLVRYEASQQIPFDMDDVVWDYQVFTSEDSPDIEVGIFAIRKDLIRKHLGYFSAAGIAPAGVQTIPAALYNFCKFDGQAPGAGAATVMIDVGAQNTDLVIVEENAAWTRNIPLGGNSFTEALVRAFKLSFAKAESLKRSAATSKYARQIFQAMRPVFADLVAEIQRSVGFYSSTHREVELKKVLALGNAFRLPGLQKYLENNLTIPGGVVKLEKFGRLLPSATSNAPQFTENVLSFAAAYGLALQGLGLAEIRASLLPTELARAAAWQRKRPYFVATAASLLISAGIPFVANALDRQSLGSDRARQSRATAQRIINEAEDFRKRYQAVETDTDNSRQDIERLLNLQKDKHVLPRLLTVVHDAMPPLEPQELERITDVTELKRRIAADPARFDRKWRGQLIVESLKVEYHKDVGAVSFGPQVKEGPGRTSPTPRRGGGTYNPNAPRGVNPFGPPGGDPRGRGSDKKKRKKAAPEVRAETAGFVVRVEGRLLYGTNRGDAQEWLTSYFDRLRDECDEPGLGFYMPDDAEGGERGISEPDIADYHERKARPVLPGADFQTSQQFPDPVTGEDTALDKKVKFAFKVKFGEKPEPKAETDTETAADAKDDRGASRRRRR